MSETSRKRGNSTCKLLGHDWMSSAAANWRVCKREQCRASERLVDGQWVSNAPLYRRSPSVLPERRTSRQSAPHHPSIWNPEGETDQKGASRP